MENAAAAPAIVAISTGGSMVPFIAITAVMVSTVAPAHVVGVPSVARTA